MHAWHSSGKSRGYRYFGAAKSLPGVKELFETEVGPNELGLLLCKHKLSTMLCCVQAPKAPLRKTRFQMHKAIDPDYYGFRDEDDGVLVRVEAEAEKLMRAQVGRAELSFGFSLC